MANTQTFPLSRIYNATSRVNPCLIFQMQSDAQSGGVLLLAFYQHSWSFLERFDAFDGSGIIIQFNILALVYN